MAEKNTDDDNDDKLRYFCHKMLKYGTFCRKTLKYGIFVAKR